MGKSSTWCASKAYKRPNPPTKLQQNPLPTSGHSIQVDPVQLYGSDIQWRKGKTLGGTTHASRE